MKNLIRKALARCTWKNAKWFARVNLQGWLIQGVLIGLLTLRGSSKPLQTFPNKRSDPSATNRRNIMPRRSRLEITRSVHRLALEELLPVAELVDVADVSELSLIRWIRDGKKGRYLDGLHRPGVGWLSSIAAVGRFRAALAAAEATPICNACGTRLVECIVGQPPRAVTICPKCPLPISIAQPAPRQPQPAA